MSDSDDDAGAKKRARLACDACRHGRRKCDGKSPCEGCVLRSIPCMFGESKKRGRKSLKELASVSVPVSRMTLGGSVATTLSRISAAGSSSQAVALPALALARGSVGDEFEPLAIDERVQEMLRAYFDKTNRMLPCVHEAGFYDALRATRGGVSRDSGALRACYFAILGVSSRMEGAVEDSERHLASANAQVCSAWPSALLVSALLLVAAQSHLRETCSDGPPLQTDLALRMASLLPSEDMPFQVLLSASFLRYALAPPGHLVWPPAPQPPIGQPRHLRLADVLGFSLLQLMVDFRDVAVEHEATFSGLLDESAKLAGDLVGYVDFPARATVLLIRALLAYRARRLDEMLAFATGGFAAMQDDKSALANFFCVTAHGNIFFCMRNLILAESLSGSAMQPHRAIQIANLFQAGEAVKRMINPDYDVCNPIPEETISRIHGQIDAVSKGDMAAFEELLNSVREFPLPFDEGSSLIVSLTARLLLKVPFPVESRNRGGTPRRTALDALIAIALEQTVVPSTSSSGFASGKHHSSDDAIRAVRAQAPAMQNRRQPAQGRYYDLSAFPATGTASDASANRVPGASSSTASASGSQMHAAILAGIVPASLPLDDFDADSEDYYPSHTSSLSAGHPDTASATGSFSRTSFGGVLLESLSPHSMMMLPPSPLSGNPSPDFSFLQVDSVRRSESLGLGGSEYDSPATESSRT